MPRAKTPPRVAGVERIHADNVEVVPIDVPEYDPDNARLHPEESLDSIKESLTAFGQRKPIVVNRTTGHVEAGNGTLEAARALGWARIAVVYVDDDPLTAMAYGLADNSTAEKSRWDEEAKIRQVLMAEAAGLDVPGFSPRQIAGMRLQMERAGAEEVKVFSDEQITEACFDHFRSTGFPYLTMPKHYAMTEVNRLANSAGEVLPTTFMASQVADAYHPHRFRASADGMRTPYQMYENDDWFRTAIRKTIEIDTLDKHFVNGLRYAHGAQVCSNFRPGFALFIYRRFGVKGGTLLDTSMGYGGRLVGFMASELGHYVGVDPSSDSYACNMRMAEELGFADRVTMHQLPAEDVPHKNVAGKCDLCFTSPPYFRKEHYSDEPTQSWVRYGDDAESWRKNFLVPLMRLQYVALRPNRHAVVNIDDVIIKGKTVPLVAWTIAAAKAAGFKHAGTEEYPLGRVPGAKEARTLGEPCLIFKKG